MNKRQQIKDLGFQELPHKTIGESLVFPLGRNRHLSFSNIGEPNEFLVIYEAEGKEITDCVILRNYDYDGYTTVEEVKQLINLLEWKKEDTHQPSIQ